MVIINQLADLGTEERNRLCDSPDKVNVFTTFPTVPGAFKGTL
jgi:hypothetical protein